MNTTLGYRLKLGVAIPSTNTSVQPEMDAMRPVGVVNHIGRMLIEDNSLEEEIGFNSVIENIRKSTKGAIQSLSNCKLDGMIIGVSPDSYWDGEKKHIDMLEDLKDLANGVDIIMSADAIDAALSELGNIKKIGVITPYLDLGDDPVSRFFNDRGYEIVKIHGLGGKSPSRISNITIEQFKHAVKTVDHPDVEVIVQVGTNVPMADFAAVAETWIGKPVLSNNAVLYWHALRKYGITDRFPNLGTLFSEH